MILDLVIEDGNPADTDRFQPMLDRHIEHYGKAPRQSAADGGYASTAKPGPGQGLGRQGRGLPQEARAGHRGHGEEPLGVSQAAQLPGRDRGQHLLPQTGYGLSRCTWKGLDHFKAYVWSSVVAYNLALFARLKPT